MACLLSLFVGSGWGRAGFIALLLKRKLAKERKLLVYGWPFVLIFFFSLTSRVFRERVSIVP